MSNAIKFTERGSIHLSVLRRGESQIEFQVTDTGIGISEEDQVRLFNIYSQIKSSASKKHKGVGLGLYISKKLAGLLGGDLIITTSKPDQGSTFSAVIDLNLSPTS
jgi:two-component system sensor histidine kinase/response regulator FitF